jgi:hypothetical protein
MSATLADDEAAYAYVRMKLGNDEYSERVKFVFVVWAGNASPNHPLLLFAPNPSPPCPPTFAKDTANAVSRPQYQNHAQSQNELPVWPGQAGYSDVCG